MMTNKLNLSCLLLLLVSLTVASSNNTTSPSLNQFVEISPSAFDVMVHAFDQLVVLFHEGQSDTVLNSTLQKLDVLKLKINQVYPKDHTLFGYVNLSSDYKNTLDKYTLKAGLHILNKYQVSRNIADFDQIQAIFQLYKDISHPQLPLIYDKNLNTQTRFDHYVVFTFKTVDKLNEYNQMYKRVLHFLEDLQLSAFAVPSEHDKKQSIQLYHLSQSLKEYKFDQNSTIAERASEILQQLNIDTLPVVTQLDQATIQRVFGGEISDQILLIHKNSLALEQLRQVKQMFIKAANYNKNEQLTYERVLFCEINSTFYDEQFNQQSNLLFRDQSGKEWNYVIMFTRTDYDKFNLKRYIYNNTQTGATAQGVIKFIEDVRMKRLQPKYKSQKVPTEAENNGVLRKIVGDSFISQVYEKADQSIIILFIDSKDDASYKQIKKQLENFAHKYRYTFDKKLIFAIFDLGKNEHKLLYLKEAPQIVLFDKANKKQTKYYRMNKGVSESLLKDWVNTEVSNVKIIESLDL